MHATWSGSTGDATHRQKKNGIKMPNDALPTNQFVRYAGKYAICGCEPQIFGAGKF
jgi:hypothetical protein